MESARGEQHCVLLIYFFVFAVTAPQGTRWVCFQSPNRLHSLVQGQQYYHSLEGHGAPRFSGKPQFSRGLETTPTFPFSQASKPEQDRSSELLRQLAGVIS